MGIFKDDQKVLGFIDGDAGSGHGGPDGHLIGQPWRCGHGEQLTTVVKGEL